MTTLLPEMLAESAAAYLRVLKDRSPDESLTPADVDAVLKALNQTSSEVCELWRLAAANIAKGVSVHKARPFCVRMQSAVQRAIQVQMVALDVAEKGALMGKSVGPDVIKRTKGLLAALQQIATEVEGLIELFSQPRKPRTEEDRRQARESFERGDYKDAADLLRERGWKGEA